MRSVSGRRLRVLCQSTWDYFYCLQQADKSRYWLVVGLVESPYPAFSFHICAGTRLRLDGRLPYHHAFVPVQLFDIVSVLGAETLLSCNANPESGSSFTQRFVVHAREYHSL
jgi:hypothetical protein